LALAILGLGRSSSVEAGEAKDRPKEETPAGAAKAAPPGGVITDEVAQSLADFNRGAALLEQYRYDEAAEAFEKVVQSHGKWTAARFNLGVACLNQQTRPAQERAMKAFEEVLAAAPDDRHARFCLGLCAKALGLYPKALEAFRQVYQADPDDPYVGHQYADVLKVEGKDDEARAILERVVTLDPGFVTGIYSLSQLYRRAQQPEKADALLLRFQELNAAELPYGSFVVKEAYGSSGKYYYAVGADRLPVPRPRPASGPRILFTPDVRTLDVTLKPWKWAGGTVGIPALAVGDLNGDERLDVVVSGVGDDGGTYIFWNRGKWKFVQGPRLADKVVSVSLGDVDNDGDLDIWLGRAGGDLLLLNDGKGNFTPSPAPAPPKDDRLTVAARLMDVDSDGDLDLLAIRWQRGVLPATAAAGAPAASMLWRNNRDGTYAEKAGALGLALADTVVTDVVYDDFDNDRDLDMILLAAGKKPIAWVNDRVGKYHLLTADETGLNIEGAVAATSGDPNKDGNRDLVVFTGKRVELFLNRGGFRFERDKAFGDQFGSLGGTCGQFVDIDNDGDLDLVIADAHRRDGTRGPVLLVNDWPNGRFLDAAEIDPGNLLAALRTDGDAVCAAADFNLDGKCDLILAGMGQKPILIENRTAGGHYVLLDLLGTRRMDFPSRSDNSAIGARVEVKSGTGFQQFVVGATSGPTAASPLRLHAGLGPHTEVEWLRIVWPDGALQAEMQLAADRLFLIREKNRKTGSCPHLFAWDGSRFDFVADFVGVGGLGFFLAPGIYARPDPTEYLPIPRLEPRDGQYVLQVVEPLEEVVYLDEAKLIAVDHPEGTEVRPHEMAAVGLPPPPFEMFCFREAIEPVRAVDHRGVDVTELVRRVDRRYAGATEPDRRFPGYARDHYVDLDFGPRLGEMAATGRPILMLEGWVEYSYSSTNYAAGQAGLRLKAPSVHVLRDGQWVELFHEAGYPAGLRHTMTLDLAGKLRPGDQKLRIASNMEIYWDRIWLARHLAGQPLRIKEVAAAGTDLHFLGYPREYSPDGRRPNLYDYTNVDSTAPWKLMKGDYTRFGEVGELLDRADDCFVIMGPGEELTLRFPAAAFGPVPPGMRRSFLLKADGYTKDMDLCTAHPDTVEPLPFHAMSGFPYRSGERYPDTEKTRDYLRRYNSRHVGGQ
jgi:tetratricopeptide (TPR) repeat protein